MDFPLGLRRVSGTAIFTLPGKILAGERSGIGRDFSGRARGDQISAGFSGAGAEVNHVIRRGGWFLRRVRRPARCCPDRAAFRGC